MLDSARPTRVLTVVGARPQFIKAAVLSRELVRHGNVRELLLHTGQHYDDNMSEIFFRELSIPRPDFQLDVGSGPHGQQTARMLEGIERVLVEQRPDWVLVYGDTNSTLAGALAASKLHIPTVHVEAGLRSGNRRMPEEINRVVVDHLSQLLLAPNRQAVENLLGEGIEPERIHEVGDLMRDAVLLFAQQARQQTRLFDQCKILPGSYVLVTVHRAENTDCPRRLSELIGALTRMATEFPIIWPMHPRTRAACERLGLLNYTTTQLRIVPPVGYLDMLGLQTHARLILTDSGGVQKEAFYLQVPCLTLRDETEWCETLEHGWNRLVPSEEYPALPQLARQWIHHGDRRAIGADFHGGGSAAARIGNLLLRTRPVYG